MTIKINQIYKSKKNKNHYVIIVGKGKHDKWKAKVLTDKEGVYNGSHTFADRTLQKMFELL